jgi:tRNA A37 threonylcarbamoyladenosine modification protein TsaB
MKIVEKSEYRIYIDSSSRDEKEVKLSENIGGKEKILKEKKGNIDIVGTIRDFLNEEGLDIKDISEFIPNLGPGSFTGLKIGVTVSNVLNWFNGKKTLDNLYYPEYGGEPNISKPKEHKKEL